MNLPEVATDRAALILRDALGPTWTGKIVFNLGPDGNVSVSGTGHRKANVGPMALTAERKRA